MFEQYVEHQSAAAILVREADEQHRIALSRIAELESELSVWKLGHREAVKDRESAEKQIRDLTEGDPIALCILDGDGCIFNRSYVSRGRDGGREAAQALSTQITAFAAKTLGKNVQVVVSCFYNKSGLIKILQDVGITTPESVHNFVLGFNTAHPLFTMTDVGPQKEAADAKIRETLRLFAKLPSCKLILAGCAHDGGYASSLQSLETEGLISKVHLLNSYTDIAYEISRLNLRATSFDGLFEAKKLVSFAGRTKSDGHAKPDPTPKGVVGLPASAVAAPKASKEVPLRPTAPSANGFTAVTRKQAKHTKHIDPSKSLSRQTPPPCNMHYLDPNGCFRADCHYSHEYILNAKQLTILRTDAKKSPCSDALYGRPCSSDTCFSGHQCPWGTQCRYGKACRFSAAMHPGGKMGTGSDSYSDESSE